MAQPGYGPYGQGQYGPGQYGQDPYGYDQPYGYDNPSGDFYNDLAPYGQWMDHPNYGPVWVPRVDRSFQPYATNGHWVITEYGNTWVSDYAWGWAPFHYGRWFLDNYYGWTWVPGYEWGPAWVSWRSGGGYYGWAPLGPGVNINVNLNIPARHWVFVPQVYITSPRLYSYCVPRPQVITIYNNTTIINNIYRTNNRAYVYGPYRNEIEYVTRSRVPVYRIDNMNRPGRTVIRDGYVGLYRPDIRNYGNNGYNRRDSNYPGYGATRPNNRSTYGNRYPDTPDRYSRGNAYPDSYGTNRGRSSADESPSTNRDYNGTYNRQNSRGHYTQPEVTQPSDNRANPFEGSRNQQPNYSEQYNRNQDRRTRSDETTVNPQTQVERPRSRFENYGGSMQPQPRSESNDRQGLGSGGFQGGRRGADVAQPQPAPEVHIQRERPQVREQQPSPGPSGEETGGARGGRRGPF
ncbi:hypothetical protein GCM10023187_43400 [Nibrella viscosa]|uniref:YXWGXW repeat-containing protein n=2 Tax=Nibrella viscosa TaxID=1084524 RepID=A0ABP8KSW4_9BACT